MSLSLNVKQFRNDNHISQEYIADKLFMCQSNYSRLENSDAACAKRLPQIAHVLGTTPEVLKNYHFTPNAAGESEAADWVKALLLEKDVLIQQQEEQINFLGRYADYLKSAWNKYIGNFGSTDNNSLANK